MYEIKPFSELNLNFITYVIGMLSSLSFTILIILTKKHHQKYTSDSLSGPQKIHDNFIPRIGGMVIITSIFIQVLITNRQDETVLTTILACGMPVFLIGLLEDITKSVTPNIRLLITLFSGFLVTVFLDLEILKTNIIFFDNYVMLGAVPFFLSILSIVLLTQAFNIIDGLDGLSLGTSLSVIIGLICLSYLYQDILVLNLTLIFFSSVFFLFIINFFTGRIFLGDGGAYFLGYFSSILLIMISSRNQEISPFAILLIIIFPIYETIRSFIRRFFSQQLKSFEPDNQHLHSIMFTYISSKNNLFKKLSNKISSCLILIFPIYTVILAVIFRESQNSLIIIIVLTILIFELLIDHLGKKIKFSR